MKGLRLLSGATLAMTALASVLMILAPGVDAVPAPQFAILDLGTLGGSSSSATAINGDGQVIGTSLTSTGERHVFSWTQKGGMVDLGTLGGNESVVVSRSVNTGGQVVGSSLTASGERHAFSWTQAGGMTDLGTLGGVYSRAVAFNDAGQIVGESTNASGELRAFLWTSGAGMTDLGSLSSFWATSQANAVNDDGWVVGQSAGQAFVYKPGGPMQGIGDLGGGGSVAWRVSDAGQVIGESGTPSGDTHPFSWTETGGTLDLGSFGGQFSRPTDVNTSGMVVGRSGTTGGETHAFTWTQASGMVDIGTLGGSFSGAYDVTENGQAAGYSTTASGAYRGFWWTASSGLVDLGTLGGDSFARAVNENGQIVGSSYNASGQERAVLWLPGDTTPPVLSVSVTPNLLWPPNHQFVTVKATVTATDDTDPSPKIELVSVTDNEPGDASGDGNTITHVVINPADSYSYPDTVQLVAERNAHGTGRIYTITYRATDASGNATIASATVAVPLTH